MTLLTLFVSMVVIGIVAGLLYRWDLIPMPIRTAIVIVAVVVIALLALNFFGVLDYLGSIRAPKVGR